MFTIQTASRGELSIVWIAAIALAVLAAFEAVDNLPAAWQHAAQTRESARSIAEISLLAPTIRETSRPQGIDQSDAPTVRWQHVTFAYGARPILKDVSLAVASGEHLGIRGPTGSGKSTMLDLVIRAWDAQAGTICLNGISVRDIALADLRATSAYMPQQIHVFNTTLRDNVRLARPTASDDEVLSALATARLAEFVGALPEGLDTVLGEHGARLSAGERRRVGFARILLTDAPLVLLDEPTEHLDRETERAMLLELKRWAAGRTMLLVSHREAPLALVDRVVTIDELTGPARSGYHA
jgi:ABC-type transport system involved in cytochrome bd biosynthesis fused ATPase/permease subunit